MYLFSNTVINSSKKINKWDLRFWACLNLYIKYRTPKAQHTWTICFVYVVVKKFLPNIPHQIFAYLITKASCNIYHSYAMKRLFLQTRRIVPQRKARDVREHVIDLSSAHAFSAKFSAQGRLALKLLDRIFFNFAKSCILTC